MDTNGTNKLSSAHTENNSTPVAKLDGVFTMEEFVCNLEADHAAAKAAKSATPAPKKLPGKASDITPASGMGPIAIGARSSKHTVALHDKCQSLGIPQPSFIYRGNGLGWSGEVSFPTLEVKELQDINDETIQPNKQGVKESLSERALKVLEQMVMEGRIKKADAVTRARTSKYMVALHDKNQKLGIPQPFFAYTGSTEVGWSAEVSFPGLWADDVPGLKNETRFPNKSEAKEALSKQALRFIEAAEKEGKFEKFSTAKRPMPQEPNEKQEPGPNYVGQLLEFQRATLAPQPTYTDYRVGESRFACQVNIENGEHAQLFGSLESHHSSKKSARQEAAHHAVEYFKAKGRWPKNSSDVGGIKKKVKLQSDVPELISSTTTTTPPSNDNHQASATLSSPGSISYASQVARLAVILSLPTPEWRYTPSPFDRDFLTVQCFFNSSSAGSHQGPIGEVRNVFGKKKAKEECARLTLEYLKEVHAHRLACGQTMMDSISGGEAVVEGALGKASEEENEAMEARRQFVTEMGNESDEETGFEDALEDLES